METLPKTGHTYEDRCTQFVADSVKILTTINKIYRYSCRGLYLYGPLSASSLANTWRVKLLLCYAISEIRAHNRQLGNTILGFGGVIHQPV